MKTQITYWKAFRAAHLVAHNWACGPRRHGHDWTAEIVIAGGPDPATGAFVTDGPRLLDLIIAELDENDLNDMVQGTEPTPEGLAAYLAERLRGLVPGLKTVTVGFPGHEASIED